jgi:hypothetical protein
MQSKINVIIFLIILLSLIIAVSIGIILPALMSSTLMPFGFIAVIIAIYVCVLFIVCSYIGIRIIKRVKEII